jgi:(1->4)-alpha-D-glucan 1-alpha-D-glucosylmutase
MFIPTATYRIQLSARFRFEDVRRLIPYLSALGVSHVYASPIFKAHRGSTHGYDMTDPNRINPELGSRDHLEALTGELKAVDMHWLQDIVPNHMAYSSENHMLMDLLEFGEASPYFDFFDIQWHHPVTGDPSPLLAPFLARFYEECLEAGDIGLVRDRNGLGITYADMRFPLRFSTYATLLEDVGQALKNSTGTDRSGPSSLRFIMNALRSLPALGNTADRYSTARKAKQGLLDLVEANPELRAHLDAAIERLNGTPGDASSFDSLDALLSQQLFRLAHWKVAAEEVNYRRFAAVNRLISLRMEDKRVFDHYHALIFELAASGALAGLRVDHIDGLYDPKTYLKALRAELPDAYIVVEKILGRDEHLRPAWPVQGSTGYDFLNHVNGVLCETRNAGRLNRIYSHFINMTTHFEDLVHRKKRLVIDRQMPEATEEPAVTAKRIAEGLRSGRDLTLHGLEHSLGELMASLAAYRTYVDDEGASQADRQVIDEATDRAIKRNPGHTHELDFLRKLLLLDFGANLGHEVKSRILDFAMRFQQLTGPVMVKGFEDTVLYLYNRHLGLNEVGGWPEGFGTTLDQFHEFNLRRLETWPHSMNTTSTHDTKRGEDVRARLNVLSEIPDEWERHIKTWRRINRSLKLYADGTRIPDRNDEYGLYQTLVGALPSSEDDWPAFRERLRVYLVKAVREAKVHTAWLEPDVEYENAFILFVERLLQPDPGNDFLTEFLPFQRKVAHYGILNSLTQTLIKLTAPGVPDLYQGSELWNLSLVDPDNRRPVDFEQRAAYLGQLRAKVDTDLSGTLEGLRASKHDGRLKLFLIYRVLSLRGKRPDVFRDGGYLPLEATGTRGRHIIAFARMHGNSYAIAIAPRFLTGVVGEGGWPFGKAVWKNTQLRLPDGFPGTWTDAVTGTVLETDGSILIGDVLRDFPVALLVDKEGV